MKTFFRLAYRYKYVDGEYSAIGPFTNIIFNAKYDERQNVNNFYDSSESYNKAMQNKIGSIDVFNFVPRNIPQDVVQVDLLYRQENSSVVYTIANIKENSPEWNAEGSVPNYDSSWSSAWTDGYREDKGRYKIVSENVKGALPTDQILRPYDNVPRCALAQEISGNRLVYANYKQGYNMLAGQPIISADYERRFSYDTYNEGGVKSVKSMRDYQIGVVFGDAYGRETPVITNEAGAVRIPFNAANVNGQSSTIPLAFKVNVENMPDWADYYKFYVKQTSGEYYNLSMYKAYTPSAFSGFDNENNHVWLSFASSERNKIQENDYITLKSSIIGGLPTATTIFNRYKVVDIKNEAPEAIKHNFFNLGEVTAAFGDLFQTSNNISKTTDIIEVDRATWLSGSGYSNSPVVKVDLSGSGSVKEQDDNKDVYVSWYKPSTKKYSERYRVHTADYSGGTYKLGLLSSISTADAELASSTGVANDDTSSMSSISDLVFIVERRESNEVEEDFSGKFFVQISADKYFFERIYSTEEANPIDQQQISGKTSIRWYQDAHNSGNDETTHIINTNPTNTPDKTPQDVSTTGITNTAAEWEALTQKTFFLDGMHMAAAQTNSSNFAKFSKQGWVGASEHDSTYGPVYNFPKWNTETGKWEGSSWINEDQHSTLTSTAEIDSITNGLQGAVRTGNEYINGGKVWVSTDESGNAPEYFYTKKARKRFFHISFLAPGKDLVPTNITQSASVNDYVQRGQQRYLASTLQGLYGGGAISPLPGGPSTFQNGEDFIALEWSNETKEDENGNTVYLEPRASKLYGNGLGYGYSASGYEKLYEELHDRQWDPTYGFEGTEQELKELKDFIGSIKIGATFKFSGNSKKYTIVNRKVKKLYNHTPFRARKVYNGSWDWAQDSVEEAINTWGHDQTSANFDVMFDKIQDFGKASNRRLCFIIEVEESLSLGNVFDGGVGNIDALNAGSMEFIKPEVHVYSGKQSRTQAFWETEPQQLADLDIYFEASDNIPLKLGRDNRSNFAKTGSRVEFPNLPESINGVDPNQTLLYWRDQYPSLPYTYFQVSPGFKQFDDQGNEINYANQIVRFYREDGVYVSGRIKTQPIVAGGDADAQRVRRFILDERIPENADIGLNWYNCFSFESGVESNRIRDDFNAMTITNGAKASATTDQEYEEENLQSGLIYSGIYNPNSKTNNLNQFIQAQKITKDLNPTYGSIQKLFSRSTDLVAFCEDRVIKILANKDAVFNADGNTQLTASENVLGQSIPFVGDYGISTNPESFASDSYRAYFADKTRGAVLRLSMDGLTPISNTGMQDWFRDNLVKNQSILGTYDQYTNTYNITLKERIEENIIENFEFTEEGYGTIPQGENPVERIDGGSNITGTNIPTNIIQQRWASAGGNGEINDNNLIYNKRLDNFVHITNWPAIPVGHFVQEVQQGTTEVEVGTGVFNTVVTGTQVVGTGQFTGVIAEIPATEISYGYAYSGSGGPPGWRWSSANGNPWSSSNSFSAVIAAAAGTGNTGYAGNPNYFDAHIETNTQGVNSGTYGTSGAFLAFDTYYGLHFSNMADSDFAPQSPFWIFPYSAPNGIPNNNVPANILNNPNSTGVSYSNANNMTIHELDEIQIELDFVVQVIGSDYKRFKYTLLDGDTPISNDLIVDVSQVPSGGIGEGQASDGASSWLSSPPDLPGTDYRVFNNSEDDTDDFGYWPQASKSKQVDALNFSLGFSSTANTYNVQIRDRIKFKKANVASSSLDANYTPTGEIVIQNLKVKAEILPGTDFFGNENSFQSSNDHNEIYGLRNCAVDKIFFLLDPGGPGQTGDPGVEITEVVDITEQVEETELQTVVSQPYIAPVPSQPIPAWAEVAYSEPFGWNLSASNGAICHSYHDPTYGPPNPGEYVTEGGVTYYVGQNNGVTGYGDFANNNTSLFSNISNSTSGTLLPNNQPASQYKLNTQNNKIYFDARYYNSDNELANTAAYIVQSRDETNFQHGHWYLVDVEYVVDNPGYAPGQDVAGDDAWNFVSSTGISCGFGMSSYLRPEVVQNFSDYLNATDGTVLTASNGTTYVPNSVLAPEDTAYGLGHYNEDSPGFHLFPQGTFGYITGGNNTNSSKNYGTFVYKTKGQNNGEYYTPNRFVARTIFQYDENAPRENDSFYGYIWGRRGMINRIDCIDVTRDSSDEGSFNYWYSTSGSRYFPHYAYSCITDDSSDIVNYNTPLNSIGYSYVAPQLYFKNSKANWYSPYNEDLNPNPRPSKYFTQSWNFPTDWNPVITPDGYRLEFTVSKNDDYGYISGSLNGYASTSINPDSGVLQGFGFGNITEEGTYIVRGNFNGVDAVTIENVTTGTTSAVASVAASSAFINDTLSGSSRKITFSIDESDGFVGSISNISFTDATSYFIGASAEAWSIQGFDQTIDNFIDFNTEESAIQFINAPFTSIVDPVRVEQFVGAFNVNDTYRLSFNYSELFGEITVYYFNHLGQGFSRVLNSNDTTDGVFSDLVQVGEIDLQLPSEFLYNTLVIHASQDNTSVVIDDVFLQRDLIDVESKTLSFSEAVTGWTSFKSFIPDNGISVSKKYFTMFEGKLYQHNHPDAQRGKFYGTNYHASLQFIFNDMPSAVKSFKTIEYEGTQGKAFVNAGNLNFTEKDGWIANKIYTDLCSGQVKEFVNKEGKWYSRIQGNADFVGNDNGAIDYGDISMQGLGIITSVNTDNDPSTEETALNE